MLIHGGLRKHPPIFKGADNWWFAQNVAAAIERIRCVRVAGVRFGNWLSKKRAERLLAFPDKNTAKGNALKTQTWTALIALVAVKFLQLQATFDWISSRSSPANESANKKHDAGPDEANGRRDRDG